MNMHAFIKHFSNAKLHCYKWSSRILTMVKYWLGFAKNILQQKGFAPKKFGNHWTTVWHLQGNIWGKIPEEVFFSRQQGFR